MLDPEYLLKVSEGAENIAASLHEYIITQIVDRMMLRIGKGRDYLFTASDRWRVQILQDAGYLYSDIIKEIAAYTGKQRKEIKSAMEEAGIKAIEKDDKIYEAAGLSPIPLEQSPVLIRLMERNMEATMGEWKNYTRTTAEAAQRLFLNECDNAYNKVMNGATAYTQAVREAIESVAAGGVTVEYSSGHKDTIETAVARAVRTGISQAAAQISVKRMDEMDWDIVLVSAHVGARTGDGQENAANHHWWQGKFYTRTGKDTRFQPLSVTGYGTGEGLCGWNCRHSLGPGDGVNNPYTALAQDDDADAGKLEKLEKRQRELERRIRKTKRAVLAMQHAVDQCKDEPARFELQLGLDKKSYLLQKQNDGYKEFCKTNNLRPLSERLHIAKWGREQAAKARGAAKRYEAAKGA